MSEEISLKDLMPNEFYINDIGLMCCELSLKEVNQITNVLTNLQQENQQLKSVLDEIRERIEFFMEDGRGSLLELLEILDKVKENERGTTKAS